MFKLFHMHHKHNKHESSKSEQEDMSRYDPNYPYYKRDVTIEMSEELGYPIIERTNNGLLYPEGPKHEVDMKQVDE